MATTPYVKTKRIIITTTGTLRLKGGIRGPIEIPFVEDVSNIGRMIMSNYSVYEVLNNGKKIKLTVHNYNKENGNNDMKVTKPSVKSAKEIIQKNKEVIKKAENDLSVFAIKAESPYRHTPKLDNYETK